MPAAVTKVAGPRNLYLAIAPPKADNDCRARGAAVSVSDILLCAIAIARDWPIFLTDPDFHSYAKILPLKLHRAT